MLISAAILTKGTVPADLTPPDAKRGTADWVLSAEDLLDFGHSPRRWVTTPRPEQAPPPSPSDLIHAQWLEGGQKPPRFVPRPETYQALRNTCPKCSSVGSGKVCKNCGVARVNVTSERPWTAATKYCAQWEARAKTRGGVIVPAAKWSAAADMVFALAGDPSVKEVHDQSERLLHVTGVWHDDQTGVEVKLQETIHWAPKSGESLDNTLATLDVPADSSPGQYAKRCVAKGDHVAAALRHELFGTATSDPRPIHLWNIVERDAPYLVSRRRAPAELLTTGRDILCSLLAAYCQCVKSGNWPAFDNLAELSSNDWSPIYLEPWMTQGVGSDQGYYALSNG